MPDPSSTTLLSALDDADTRTLLEAIFERYGYDFRGYAPGSMNRRLRFALARSGQPTLRALLRQVVDAPDAFARILGDLTVRVSELFRDPAFFRTLRERVVPFLRTYPLINIWHAGCATGEEAYSTAVMLREEGLLDRCQIYATDLSSAAVEQAKQGVFSADTLPTIVERYRRAGGADALHAHATIAYGQIAFRESLRRRILFFQHDLVSDYVFAEVQVVFCRNVLIYFGRSLREHVIHRLTASLCPGGFLCLGSSERLSRTARTSLIEFASNERIYRLVGAA